MIFLGVEYGAKFTLEGPNGVKAVFNDSTDADYVGDLSPESSGLDAPEIREDSADKVEADGAIFGDFFAGKRPVILQGTIIATSKAQRNERVGKLRAASNAKTTNSVLWWEDAAAGKLRVELRRQQPLRITKGWVKEFQLSMVSADSRILSYNLSTVTGEKIENKSVSKFPTAVEEISYGVPVIYTGPWTSIANVKAEDGVFATNASASPKVLAATNFAFGLSAAASVQEIEVYVKGKGSVTNNYTWAKTAISATMNNGPTAVAEALNSGTFVETNLKFTTTNAVLGGPSFEYLGSKKIATSVANSAGFGVALLIPGAAAGTLSIDDINILLFYAIGPELKITNNGNSRAPSKITITSGSKLVNPSVTNVTTGETFSFTGSMGLGHKLIIDTESFTVIEEGTGIISPINRYNSVAVGSAWPQVAPGENVFVFGASEVDETAGKTKFQVDWRHAWE